MDLKNLSTVCLQKTNHKHIKQIYVYISTFKVDICRKGYYANTNPEKQSQIQQFWTEQIVAGIEEGST